MVQAPCCLATSATTGAAPRPVPPPMPAYTAQQIHTQRALRCDSSRSESFKIKRFQFATAPAHQRCLHNDTAPQLPSKDWYNQQQCALAAYQQQHQVSSLQGLAEVSGALFCSCLKTQHTSTPHTYHQPYRCRDKTPLLFFRSSELCKCSVPSYVQPLLAIVMAAKVTSHAAHSCCIMHSRHQLCFCSLSTPCVCALPLPF